MDDVATLMKHAHDLERRGRKEDAVLTYSAASEIARMRAGFHAEVARIVKISGDATRAEALEEAAQVADALAAEIKGNPRYAAVSDEPLVKSNLESCELIASIIRRLDALPAPSPTETKDET